MVAAQLLPVWSMTLWLLAKSIPLRLHMASMILMLAWWGRSTSTSSGVTPARSRATSTESVTARTATLNTSRPSIVMKESWSPISSRR